MFSGMAHHTEEMAKDVLQVILDMKISPLTVSQRVLAMHPSTRELRTA